MPRAGGTGGQEIERWSRERGGGRPRRPAQQAGATAHPAGERCILGTRLTALELREPLWSERRHAFTPIDQANLAYGSESADRFQVIVSTTSAPTMRETKEKQSRVALRKAARRLRDENIARSVNAGIPEGTEAEIDKQKRTAGTPARLTKR